MSTGKEVIEVGWGEWVVRIGLNYKEGTKMVKKTVTVKAPELRSLPQKVQRWPRRSAEDSDPEGLRVVFRVLAEARKNHPGWKTANVNYETGEVTLTYPSFHEQEVERLKRRIRSVNVLMDVARLKKFFRR